MFFDREFFRRRWTIQERYYAGLGVGLNVHCGKSTALWRPYEHGKALRRLEKGITEQYYDQRIQKAPVKVTSPIPLAEKPFAEGYDTVLSFMERHSDAQCSDPRDKVLSLLDVITDEYHFTLLPPKLGDRLAPQPDLRYKLCSQTYPDEVYREYVKPFILGKDGLHVLHCNARLFDEIEQILPSSLSMISVQRQISSMASACDRAGLLAEEYRRPHATEGLNIGQDQIDSLFMSWRWCFRTVSVTDVSDLARYSSDDSMVTIRNAVANAFVLSSHRNYIESTNSLSGPRLDSELCGHKKKVAMRGRTLYITKRGYIGIGPRDTRNGDQIWMLAQSQSKTPFVLRAVDNAAFVSDPEFLSKETWQQFLLEGGQTANLIGAAHLFPPSASDIDHIIHDLELQVLCILWDCAAAGFVA